MSGTQEPPANDMVKESEYRETWCAVERMKEEAWCRKNRKHYKHHLESHVFDEVAVSVDPTNEPRCTFEVNAPTHLERRHFPAKHCKSFYYYYYLLSSSSSPLSRLGSQYGGLL